MSSMVRFLADHKMTASREQVLKALSAVTDPYSKQDIVTAGLVRALSVEDGTVRFVMEIDPARAQGMTPVKTEAEAALTALEGVETATVVMTAHSSAPPPPDLGLGKKPEAAGPAKIPGVDRILGICTASRRATGQAES